MKSVNCFFSKNILYSFEKKNTYGKTLIHWSHTHGHLNFVIKDATGHQRFLHLQSLDMLMITFTT